MLIRKRGWKWVVAVLALLGTVSAAQAVIKVLTPLRNILNDSQYVLLAKVDKFFPDKPAMVLTVEEDFKGKATFRRLPISMKADKDADKEQHFPKLLKRLGPDLPIMLFVNERAQGKRLTVFGYTNGTWFTIIGQKTDDDTYAWSLTNAEPFLRRTFKGTTDELKKIVVDGLSGKAKPPEANPKEEPGFGPEIEKKKMGWRIRIDSHSHQGPLFGVIPMVGAPIAAMLAALFPAVFGGVAFAGLFRQWRAYFVIVNVVSIAFLLYVWPFTFLLLFRNTWFGSQAGLWFAMTVVTAVGVLWAWRRQMNFLAAGEDAESIHHAEKTFLLILTVLFALTVVFYLAFLQPGNFDFGWNLVLVLSIGVWFALVMKGVRGLLNFQSLSRSTEGIILGAMLVSFLVVAAARWGGGDVSAAGAIQIADNPNTDGYVEEVKERWIYRAKDNGFFVSMGLVHGDKFFIGSAHPTFKGGILFCLDRQTGKKIWEFEDDGDAKQSFSSPTIADGRLYVGEGFHDDPNCRLYCVDIAKGTKIWHFQTTSQTESSPVVVNGKVFFGAGNDGVYCVNAATKEKIVKADSKDTLWQFPKKNYKGRLLRFGATPAVVGKRLYIGSGVDRNQPKDKGETALFCIDTDTGEQKWKVAVDLPSWGAPVVDGEEAFFVLGNGDIFTDADKPGGAVLCLDPATGKEKWSVKMPNGILDRPAVDKTSIYCSCRDMHVYCLDRKTGKEKWKRFMQSPVVASPALAGDKNATDSVIACATDGLVSSLDAKTGDVQWKFDLTAKRAILVSAPQVVIERTRIGERRQIYFGAGIGGSIQGGDAGSGPAVVYCLDNRLVPKAPEKKEE